MERKAKKGIPGSGLRPIRLELVLYSCIELAYRLECEMNVSKCKNTFRLSSIQDPDTLESAQKPPLTPSEPWGYTLA